MSIEAALAKLTAAIEENTEELKFLTSAARAGQTAQKDKPAPKAAATEEAEKPARATSSRSRKEKAPTVKEISDATKAFLDVDDETEYEERADIVKRIVKKYKAKKMSEIDDANRAEAMKMLEVAKNGDDPFEGEGGDDENDLA